MPGNWHVRFGRRLGETGSPQDEHRAPSPPYWGHFGVTELPDMGLVCYRHHELCHEGGWNLAWTDDGRLLTIPPSPDWPVPRDEPPPTDAQDERWPQREEDDKSRIREMLQARMATKPPPELVPF